MITKKIALYLIICSAFFTLTACNDEVQIFKNQTDPTALVPLSNDELSEDTYYVKNGTKFFSCYTPKGSVSAIPDTIDETRVLTVIDDATLIPPYYKSEVLAYYSEKKSIEGITLERYQTLGYSIGVYNGILTDDGVQINFSQQACKKSSFYDALYKPTTNDIIISAINGEKIEQKNFNSAAGVIVGLEKGKTYTVSIFEGTKYKEIEVVADTLMLQAFELYPNNPDINRTSNNYIEFSMPSNMKSGYYMVNNAGLFQYFNYNRGERVDSEANMNEAYYESELDKLAAYSRQYTIQVPQKVKNMQIEVEYTNAQYDTSLIKGYAFSPDGKKYEMNVDTKEKTISTSLSEASAGTWTVNVIPKSLNITNVNIKKDELKRDLTLKQTNVVFDENTENILFEVEYSNNEAEINGVIVAENGDTWTMNKEVVKEKSKDGNNRKTIERYFLRYNANFVPEGVYAVKVFYDVTATDVGDVTTVSTSEQQTDVFVIEE